MHAVIQFGPSTVTVSAANVRGFSTPAARVTWSTTVPPECVSAMTVEFRTGSHSGSIVATYITTNASQTEIIQTGLQCATDYFVIVVVNGETSNGVDLTLRSRPMQVFVGGKGIVCMRLNWYT